MDELSKNPKEYFDYLKQCKIFCTDEDLNKAYENGLILLSKFISTGQVAAARKLMFHLETVKKERELIKMGINSFVYKDDIDNFIDNIERNVVKIIELSRYEREIPDEIANVVQQTKDIFDEFYVVFTDYTGKAEKQAEKERDPILFGTFQNREKMILVERFYFLGDWVDNYCDLTFDKMLSEIQKSTGKNVEMKISTPLTIEELRTQLGRLENSKVGTSSSYRMKESTSNPIKMLFKKVRSVIKK